MRRAWLAMLVVACSSDDAIDVDAGGDATMDVNATDAPDAGDAFKLDEPYPDCCPGPPSWLPIATFQQDLAHALCNRMSNCCNAQLDAAAFDLDACVGGVGQSGFRGTNAELLVPGVLDGGQLALDPTASASCLAGVATLSCPDMTSQEITLAWTNCNAAVTGTNVIAGPCRADVECVPTAYCDTDAGKCVALGGQDAACQRTDQCAYKGGFGPLYCNGATCEPRLPLDASCANDDTCESGICASSACASSTPFNACAPDGGP